MTLNLSNTTVPAWIAAALGAATLAMFAGVVLLALRSKRAVAAQANPTARDQKVLRRLFLAALIPTLVVIAAVMGISFIGLSSFARHDMGWHSWVSMIVPLSLDGISITFGFWAFVAVKRGRHPGRSEKIVYVGALISAWINYNHGRQEWTGAAGVYLGFLSLASAWMFHELLTQFMDAQEARPRARRNGIPMFGERWLWAFWSTLMARRAWVVHPPSLDVEPTAANALAHLEMVRAQRATKRLRHQAAVDAITRELGHNQDSPAIKTLPAPTTVPAATTSVPPTDPVPSTSTVRPATTDTVPAAAASTPPAVTGTPVPTPAVVAPRITPRTQPSARPVPATDADRPAPRPRPLTSAVSKATLPASSTDSPVNATEPVQQLALPMTDPALLGRATQVARQYRTDHGTPITAGQLAVRLRVTTDHANHLLQAINDSRTSDHAVNGRPVKATR